MLPGDTGQRIDEVGNSSVRRLGHALAAGGRGSRVSPKVSRGATPWEGANPLL